MHSSRCTIDVYHVSWVIIQSEVNHWLHIDEGHKRHMHVFLQWSRETGTSSPTSSSTQGFPTVWRHRQPSCMHCCTITSPRFGQRKAEMCSIHASVLWNLCQSVLLWSNNKITWNTSSVPLPHSPQQAASTLAPTDSLLLERSLLDCAVLRCAVLCWPECPPVFAASVLCFGVSASEPCLPPELLSSRLISSDLWGGREWGEARLYSYPGWITVACGYQDWATKPPPLPVQTQFRGCEKKGAVYLSYLLADWNDHEMSIFDQIWNYPNGISIQLSCR